MDETVILGILRSISFFSSIVSIFVGLDLLSGARITSTLKEILDKEIIMKVDKLMISRKIRIILGILLMINSGLMILLIKKAAMP